MRHALWNRVRDMLALEEGDSLWLASGTPRRWLSPGQKIEVRNLATHFGPLSYELNAAPGRVNATIQLPMRNPCRTAWLVVRGPEAKPMTAVEIDGKPWKEFDAAGERVRLRTQPGK